MPKATKVQAQIELQFFWEISIEANLALNKMN